MSRVEAESRAAAVDYDRTDERPPLEIPYGWVELSGTALRRLRGELEEGNDGVVDEMGVLAIHDAYAERFFPGTSVLHARPRHVFFVCCNLLHMADKAWFDEAAIDLCPPGSHHSASFCQP